MSKGSRDEILCMCVADLNLQDEEGASNDFGWVGVLPLSLRERSECEKSSSCLLLYKDKTEMVSWDG